MSPLRNVEGLPDCCAMTVRIAYEDAGIIPVPKDELRCPWCGKGIRIEKVNVLGRVVGGSEPDAP